MTCLTKARLALANREKSVTYDLTSVRTFSQKASTLLPHEFVVDILSPRAMFLRALLLARIPSLRFRLGFVAAWRLRWFVGRSVEHRVPLQARHRIWMNLADVQHPDIILDCVYLGIVDPRKITEITFIVLLLAYHPDGIFDKVLPNNLVFCLYPLLFRRVLAGVDYCMLLWIWEIAFECCLAGVGMYRPMHAVSSVEKVNGESHDLRADAVSVTFSNDHKPSYLRVSCAIQVRSAEM